jgi:hypothetical protein
VHCDTVVHWPLMAADEMELDIETLRLSVWNFHSATVRDVVVP